MVSPFQAQQYSDPRVAVLQNAFNAQNQRELQSMQNKNRTLNSALTAGGGLLGEYFERANDRSQASEVLQQQGMEGQYGDGKIGLDALTKYINANVNVDNAYTNRQKVTGDNLQYLPDGEVQTAASQLNTEVNSQPMFSFGRSTGKPTAFGNAMAETGSVPISGRALPTAFGNAMGGEQTGSEPVSASALPTAPAVPNTDQAIDELTAELAGKVSTSPMMRGREKDIANVSEAESNAVTKRMEAKEAFRKGTMMEKYSTMPTDKAIDFSTGEDLTINGSAIKLDASTMANKSYLQTLANSNDEKGLVGLTSELYETLSATDTYLALINKTLTDLGHDKGKAKAESEDMISNTGRTIQNFTRGITKNSVFSKDLVSTEIMADLNVLKGFVAKKKAKALEGGRVTEIDFTSMVETLAASPTSDPKQLRANALVVSLIDVNKALETAYGMGYGGMAQKIIDEVKILGGERVLINEAGKITLKPIREVMGEDTVTPEQEAPVQQVDAKSTRDARIRALGITN